MMRWPAAAAIMACAILSGAVHAAERSKAARADFQRAQPCPITGAPRGACPGWQVDHRIALCAGGADRAGNMQWLTVEAHKRKTRQDIAECRSGGR